MNFIEFSPESDPIDIKAEIVASEFIRNGVKEEAIGFQSKSGFKRQFDKDIQRIQFLQDVDDSSTRVHIEVNREGLYDMLPEGLFHFDDEKTKEKAGKKGLTVSKLKKQQETEARKFFQPIENEFYQLLSHLQIKESENLSYFSPEVNRNLFYQIYGYLPDFNDNQIAKLLYFLPLAFKLKGNLRMVEYILQNLLDHPVEIVLKNNFETRQFVEQKSLKGMLLGIDSVVGSAVHLYQSTVHVRIFELQKDEVSTYFENGVNFRIIEKVMGFFLPVQYNFEVSHFFTDADKYAVTEQSCIGYNSWI